jgi:hypothetical protein
VTFKADYVEKRSRLTTFFRVLLAIPHVIFLYFYGLAAGIVVIIAWFALLFTGRYPQGMYDFVAGSLRYSTRVYGYLWLLNDEYPPFSGDAATPYPVDLIIGPPKPEYSRLKVLFRIILAIPVLIIHYAMQIVAEVGAVIAWFAIVALGRQPKGLQDMIVLGTSYQQRAYAYLALITEDWPPFTDETEGRTVEAAPTFGALAASPPAAGPEHPTSVPPGGYASPEREAAFPSPPPPPSAPEPDPPTALAEPAAPEAPATEPSFTVEPAESAAPESPPPAPPAPPAAAPEPEPEPEPPSAPDPTGPTSGDPLGGSAAPPPPPSPAEPEPPTEPSPPSPGDWPDPEPASGPPSPGDWPDPEPPTPPREDDEDEPPPGPFGPSSTNP